MNYPNHALFIFIQDSSAVVSSSDNPSYLLHGLLIMIGLGILVFLIKRYMPQEHGLNKREQPDPKDPSNVVPLSGDKSE